MKLGMICVLVGLASVWLGYLIGRPGGGPELGKVPVRGSAEEEVAGTPVAVLARTWDGAGDDEVATALEKVVEMGGGDALATLFALASVDDEQLRTEVAFCLLGQMGADELEAMAKGLEDPEKFDEFESIFDDALIPVILFDRWAKLAPDQVIRHVTSPLPENGGGDDGHEPVLWRALTLSFVAQRDPEAAFAAADKMRQTLGIEGVIKPAEIGKLVDTFLSVGVALRDPVEGLRVIRQRDLIDGRNMFAEMVFEVSGPHAQRMLDELQTFPEGDGRDGMIAQVYSAWGAYDLEAAIASLGDSTAEGRGRELFLKVVEAGGGDAPERALELLSSFSSDDDLADEIRSQVLDRWVSNQPGPAMAWARGSLAEDEFLEVFEGYGSILSVEQTKGYIDGLSDDGRASLGNIGSFQAGSGLVAKMVKQDPVGAVEWLSERGMVDAINGRILGMAAIRDGASAAISLHADLPDGVMKKTYEAQIARSGSAEVVEWAEGLNAELHNDAVGGWAALEPELAVEYAAGKSPELLSTAIKRWGYSDPTAAVDWAVGAYPEDGAAAEALLDDAKLFEKWGERDPLRAAEAARGLGDEFAGRKMEKIVGAWAGLEPGRASAYIAEELTESGAVRDSAIAGLVGEIEADDPEAARAWAGVVSDAGLRERLEAGIGRGSKIQDSFKSSP